MRSDFWGGTRSLPQSRDVIVFGEADPPSHVDSSSCASRLRPVSNKQAVHRPSGASAKISAPHFRQTRGALLMRHEFHQYRLQDTNFTNSHEWTPKAFTQVKSLNR